MRGRKSNFVACVHCRQMKVACDAPSNFPAGCSRCAKAGKFCSVDPSFKRTKRRQRLQQVEQELREVKVAMSSLKEQPHDNTSNESHTPVLQLPESSNSVPLPQATATLDDLLVPTARSIGSVQLSTSLIKELLTEYYQFYHPACPILPPLSAFVAHSDESPFLFWTVMLTALRAKPELKGFFVPLVVEVSRMAYDCIQPKNASLHAVQALLLLCYWNLPFEKLPFDPSLSFVNMATQICLRMGLHRPGFAAEFDRVSAVHNTINIPRQIAWIFCFASNVSVNGQLGLPPTVRLDRGLLDVLATKPTWLPDTLYCQMHISHQLLKILTTLGCHESSATGLLPKPDHLVPVFETELRVLEAHLSPYWSRVDYINFCTCKFVLYILAISAIDSDGVDFDAVADDKRSQWIVQAYMCVIASIQAASTIQDQLIKMPTRIYKALAADVSFLVLLKCSKHYYLVDNSALSTAIRQGWELSRKFEIVPNDFITRSCSLIERLSIYSETLRPEDKTEDLITTKARMGFNVARSTALLVHRKIVKNGQENETAADDPTEQANEFNMEMADLEFFLDFDWNESLLSLPS